MLVSGCVTTPPYRGGNFANLTPDVLTADERGYDTPQTMPLASGQVMALRLHLEQAAYVYVFQRRGQVMDSVYETPSGSGPFGPGEVRIPKGDSYVRVPQLSPGNRLCVLLSAHPIEPHKRACPFQRQHLNRHPPIQSFLLTP